MKKQQTYKEFQNQNFLEIEFQEKKQQQAQFNSVLSDYNLRNKTMAEILGLNADKISQHLESSPPEEVSPQEQFQTDQDSEQVHKEFLKNYLDKQKQFEENKSSLQGKETNVETLKKMLNETKHHLIHPYLNPKSAFYLDPKQEGIKRVEHFEDFQFEEDSLVVINFQ